MRNGLKLFENFSNIILESRVGANRFADFITNYGVASGKSAREDVIVRNDSNCWPTSLDTKIYFDAPEWVLKSLEKLGVHVLKGIVHCMKKQYTKKGYESIKKCKYSISDNWFFWVLVNYGYRLGENKPISFETHQLQQHLHDLKIEPLFHINYVESDNPIYEAKMFAA